ncbi:DUF4956 domain-containing protein [Paenibacillus sp. FSL M7-1455]|uniref:DUF4956 domain-containing protein n=1 Tax=Paenibacillus cookii TaxID=157839 RepID=A0ABQ4LXU0_9BACL|nr:DUF4956 domain-containing protein [Paenibacillus cookii]GIO68009.1 DUF4956 domain-containing protein [Paenibacillus cookii]HWO54317.1 DUF4956 domain-containing protein [Paenibacillus cookii]
MGDNLNFQDLFKKSVLHLEAFRDISYIDLFLGLISSFAIGMFIFWIYKKTFRGVVYSYNYNVSFVLMTMITTLIIMTISTNIVLSLGMVGALSIVRFRTAVKDPLDIVYMFWSIAAGIACGAKVYPAALIGSAVFGIVLIWLARKKVKEMPYLLIIRHTEAAADEVRVHLRKLAGTLKSKTVRKEYTEITYEVRIRDDNTAFVNEISAVKGVQDASLINYTGDYAQ